MHHHHRESPKTVSSKPTAFRTSAARVPSPMPLMQNLTQLSLGAADASSATTARRQSVDAAGGLREMNTSTRMQVGLVQPIAFRSTGGAAEPRPHRRRVIKCRRRRHANAPTSPRQQIPLSPCPDSPALDRSYLSSATTSEQSSLMLQEEFMDVDPIPAPIERSECMNPVAFTLWRGGEEDREWLQEQDRYTGPSSHTSSSSPSSVGRIPAPRQVSNNLRDVYGANYSCEISRPIPMMARRTEDYYYH